MPSWWKVAAGAQNQEVSQGHVLMAAVVVAAMVSVEEDSR
jgi:hypothetical protein